MSDIDEIRRRRLEQLFSAFNLHDGAAVMACMTNDITFNAAAGPEVFGRRFDGHSEVRAAFERTWMDMPDVSWQCTRHAVFGDRGLSEWIFRATTADGKRIEAEGCDIFTFRDDMICAKSAFRKDRPAQMQNPAPAKAVAS
jgi:ketosteroid isomerase-like protein